MEAPLEIRYAGVVIGRAQDVRSADGDTPSFFIPIREPMPVGTVLRLRSGDRETPARVVHAVESADPATCGMQVRTIGEAEEVAPEFIPPPVVLAAKVKPATPTPVVEVDLGGLETDNKPAEATTASDETLAASERTATLKMAPVPEDATAVAPTNSAPGADAEVAAVPEVVPPAPASSPTSALAQATESVPASVAKATETGLAAESAGSPSGSADAATSSGGKASSADKAATAAQADSSAVAVQLPLVEDLPPARPIEPSGRRKTKRRR
ncbi:MAG TPA: hypothetical protein VIM14_00830 [Polyangia bacterium]